MIQEVNFEDIVGQNDIKKTLIETIIVCIKEKQPIPNILIAGHSGCGKTTLAKAVANLIKADFYNFYARNIDSDINEFVSDLLSCHTDNKLIFIDEVHQLSPDSQENLYPILDSNNITLFCATTDTGRLLRPFQNRFKLFFTVSSLPISDVAEIINRFILRENITITTQAKSTIAIRSRGIPRIIENYIKGCWQKAKFKFIAGQHDKEIITQAIAIEYFNEQGIDILGLTKQERSLLKALVNNGGTLNLTTLCSICQIDKSQFTEFYEPYLMQIGMIVKNSRGRSITPKGILHISTNVV